MKTSRKTTSLSAAAENIVSAQGLPGDQGKRFQLPPMQPRHPEVLTILGVVHAQSGQHAAATDCFTQLVKADPRSASAHHNLGIALRQQGATESAATI